jgi:hypothetical protein
MDHSPRLYKRHYGSYLQTFDTSQNDAILFVCLLLLLIRSYRDGSQENTVGRAMHTIAKAAG